MEKKRRARINQSLGELRRFLLDSGIRDKKLDPEGSCKRVEKADILELTVRFLHESHMTCGSGPVTHQQKSRNEKLSRPMSEIGVKAKRSRTSSPPKDQQLPKIVFDSLRLESSEDDSDEDRREPQVVPKDGSMWRPW